MSEIETSAWDGRPQNPERDGAHVVRFSYGTDKAGLVLHNPPLQAWWIANKGAWQFGGERWHRSTNWMRDNRAVYLGPCITPAERDALAARVAKEGPSYDLIYAALTKVLMEGMDSKQISYLANPDDCKGGRHILTEAVRTALAAWRAASGGRDGER